MCTNSYNEQKTQSEEDGSSASTSLIAHDSPRLANYALWSIQHKPINHNRSQQQHLCRSNARWRWPRRGRESLGPIWPPAEGGLDLRGTVGHRHEKSDREPQSLQQDDNQPLRPVNNHITDWAPPARLEENTETLLRVFQVQHCKTKMALAISTGDFILMHSCS